MGFQKVQRDTSETSAIRHDRIPINQPSGGAGVGFKWLEDLFLADGGFDVDLGMSDTMAFTEATFGASVALVDSLAVADAVAPTLAQSVGEDLMMGEGTFGVQIAALSEPLVFAEAGLAVAYVAPDTFALDDDRMVADLDAVVGEDLVMGDQTLYPTIAVVDSFDLIDHALGPNLVLQDTYRMQDGGLAITVAALPEVIEVEESRLQMLADFELWGDAYTDEDVPNGNFGGVTALLARPSVVAVNGARRVLLKFNFRNQTSSDPLWNWTHISGQEDLDLQGEAEHDGLVGNESFQVFRILQAADPWTEGTVTWNNAPAHNTQMDNGMTHNQNRSTVSYNLDASGANPVDVSDALGNWLSLELRKAALTNQSRFYSREDATNSHPRPSMLFEVRRVG